MEIKGSGIQSKLSVYRGAQVQAKNVGAAKSEKPEASMPQQDRVVLSERGREIADAQRAIAFIPDVREFLVSQIQTDVLDKTYIVDNRKVAEGILRESMVNQAAMM